MQAKTRDRTVCHAVDCDGFIVTINKDEHATVAAERGTRDVYRSCLCKLRAQFGKKQRRRLLHLEFCLSLGLFLKNLQQEERRRWQDNDHDAKGDDEFDKRKTFLRVHITLPGQTVRLQASFHL